MILFDVSSHIHLTGFGLVVLLALRIVLVVVVQSEKENFNVVNLNKIT